MPARTGAEFLDRLSRTRTHVEIQGRNAARRHRRPSRLRQRRPHLRGPIRPPARPRITKYPDLSLTDHRRSRGHQLPHPAHPRGPGQARPGVQADRGRLVRHARPHRRLPQQRPHGAGVSQTLVRPDRHRVRRQHHPVLRAGPRAGPALHPHPHPPAGQPRAARQPAGRRRPDGAHHQARTTTASSSAARGCSPPSARSPTSCWSSPRPCCAGTPGGQALLVRVRDPDRREGPAVHRPGAVRLRPQPLRPPARLPLRRVRRGGGLRRRARPLRALLHARRPRDLQRLLHQDGRHRST